MNILVVTTFNNKLESAYAHRFRETYNWPFQLKVYNEDTGMYAQIPELKEFVDRNKDRHKNRINDIYRSIERCIDIYL